jgi:hypothetical protein
MEIHNEKTDGFNTGMGEKWNSEVAVTTVFVTDKSLPIVRHKL